MDSSVLIQKLDSGDVSNIVPELKSALAGSGHSTLAHRALPRISNLYMKCSRRTEPVIADEDAVELVLCCIQAIKTDLTNNDNVPANFRTILSVYNVLHTFHGKGKHVCNIYVVKILKEFLPILVRMCPTMTEADFQSIIKYVILIRSLVGSADDNFYKADPSCEHSPQAVWSLMLQVCSLLSLDKSITHIFRAMNTMSMNFEKHLGGDSNQKACAFNKILLQEFMKFWESCHFKLVAVEDDVNKFFSVLVPTLWQFVFADLKSETVSNCWDTILILSKFVKSFLCDHQDHTMCFDLITRIFKTFLFEVDHPPEEKKFRSDLQIILQKFEENRTKKISLAFTWVLYIGGQTVSYLNKLTKRMVSTKQLLTKEVLSLIFNVTMSLSKLLVSYSTSNCYASNGETCPCQGDAVLPFKTVNVFVELCVDHKKENAVEWSDMLPLIQDSFSCLQSIVDKATDGKCVKAQVLKERLNDISFWVAIPCYEFNNWEYGQNFLNHALKYLYSLKKELSSTQLQRIFVILSRLSVCYEKQGHLKEAKAAVLLHVILNLKYKTAQLPFLRDQWSLLQNARIAEAKSSDQFLKRELFLLKSLCAEFDVSPQLLPHLLLWELSCYVLQRIESSDVILNAWLALKALKPSPLILLEGSAMACQALFSSSDTVDWYDLLSTSLSSWLSQVNGDELCVALCSMAVHYQTKFLIMAQKHFDENESKVEEVPIYTVNPSCVRQPEDVINQSDICQVQSSFPNLNLLREQKLMDLLDTAVNYWRESIQAGLNSNYQATHFVVVTSRESLLHIGFLYLLWGHNSAAAKTFDVCCNFAMKMGLDDVLLQALSGLMNTIEVKKEKIKEADAILERLKNHQKISYLTKVYYTSRAFQALRTGTYSEGLKLLEDVVDYTPTPSTIWCWSYGKLLQAAYSLLPKSELDETEFGGTYSAYQSLVHLIRTIQNKRLSSSPLIFAAVINQTLSSSLWIGGYYSRLQMPREARSFLRHDLMIALKLGLATRAAEFICELAFVDLLTEKTEEAVAKIVDLQGILGNIESQPDSEDNCAEEEDDAFLLKVSVSHRKSCDNNFGSSPGLQENEKFNLPITSHGHSCKCYMCRNYSVQNVWLMYRRLQARVNMLHFNVHKSLGIYKEALNDAKLILQKLGQVTCSPGFLLQRHQVACTDIYLRLDFVDMLIMYESDEQAQSRNSGIFRALKDLKSHENKLLAEVLEQKACIMKIKEQKEKKTISPRISKTPVCVSVSASNIAEKTPKQSAYSKISSGESQNLGRKRLDLITVQSPNGEVRPLTDKQFYTPKSPLGIRFASDEEESSDQNNPGSVSQKLLKTTQKKSDSNELSSSSSDLNKQETKGKTGSRRNIAKSTDSKSTEGFRSNVGLSLKEAKAGKASTLKTKESLFSLSSKQTKGKTEVFKSTKNLQLPSSRSVLKSTQESKVKISNSSENAKTDEVEALKTKKGIKSSEISCTQQTKRVAQNGSNLPSNTVLKSTGVLKVALTSKDVQVEAVEIKKEIPGSSSVLKSTQQSKVKVTMLSENVKPNEVEASRTKKRNQIFNSGPPGRVTRHTVRQTQQNRS